MADNWTVRVDGKEYSFAKDTTFWQALEQSGAQLKYPALGAVMGSQVYPLSACLPGDGDIAALDITHEEGARIYARSASFLLVRAVRELFADATLWIDYSMNQALYCELRCGKRLTPANLKAIEARMRALAERDEPFEPVSMPVRQARELLVAGGRQEVADLLTEEDGTFTGYRYGDMLDTWYGPLVPSAGYLKLFHLHYYVPGFLLMIPHGESPDKVPPFDERPKMSAVYNEAAEWERLIGVTCMADLNHTLRTGGSRELVRVCEAWQDRKIAEIADKIVAEKRRVVLIAGPSSSGKTTFAHRLTVHLNSYGLHPLALSLDDYYLDRVLCPRDENGQYDLESIRALDVGLFEEQVSALLAGEAVDLARFDFLTGRSGRSGQKVAVKEDQPLIIEGINGLNDSLTRFIPPSTKYRIYVSALMQLNIDAHNRVATTDVRLIRRMVRDMLSRGHSADKTIESWPSVHGAEFRNIFPLQENADAIFSSALVYELAALRTAALPLLQAIPEGHPAHMEADRLAAFLSLVEPLPCPDEIPPTSILREFIGGCTFYLQNT